MNQSKPFFSVIVPVYNGGRFIENIVANIRRQMLPASDWELLLVDDVSTDDTRDVIRTVIEANDDVNIRLLCHDVNKRQGGGRNTGIRAANGRYVVYLDQDDSLNDGALSRIRTALEEQPEPLDMLMISHVYHREDGTVVDGEHEKNHGRTVSGLQFLKDCQIGWPPWLYVYRRDFLLDNNLFFVEHLMLEDVDFVMRAISKAERICYRPIVGVHYEIHDYSQTNSHKASAERLRHFFWRSEEIGKVADELAAVDSAAADIVRNHSNYSYRASCRGLGHIRGFREKLNLVNEYVRGRFTAADGYLLSFASAHPYMFTCIVHAAGPAGRVAMYLREVANKIKRKVLAHRLK